MITPEEIKEKARRLWDSGRVLRAELSGEALFPWMVPFRRPTPQELLKDFSKIRSWLNELKRASKEEKGFGYNVTYREVNHRKLGVQLLPERVQFDTSEDLCRYVGVEKSLLRSRELFSEIREARPELSDWLKRSPLRALEHRDQWTEILAVLTFFLSRPKPRLYLRQLDIPGVDTKFIETNKALFRELLDLVLPVSGIDPRFDTITGGGFERRFGLKFDEPLIRFRLLDLALVSRVGFQDLTLTLSDFSQLKLDRSIRIFVTENKINGLSFPLCANALVIFGLGYGVALLKDVDWLKEHETVYWGDIDTHGFSILSLVRCFLPSTRSLLMDAATLHRHKLLWTQEPPERRFIGELNFLTQEEQALYDDLRNDRIGARVRLEQERIPYGEITRAIESVARY